MTPRQKNILSASLLGLVVVADLVMISLDRFDLSTCNLVKQLILA